MRGQTHEEKTEATRAKLLKAYRALPLPLRLAWETFCFARDRTARDRPETDLDAMAQQTHECNARRCAEAIEVDPARSAVPCGHCGEWESQLLYLSTSTYNEYGPEVLCISCVRAMAKLVGP